VFSTYLYTGNGSSLTITNSIDLSTKGGLVWLKSRSEATENLLYDTIRGTYNYLISSSTGAQTNGSPTGVSSFNTTGFGVAGTTIGGGTNANGTTYASWTFRKQPKFFDVVTLNSSTTTYSHNLGSTPGCIIAKCTDASGAYWVVWHRSFANTTNNYLSLNTTDAVDNFTNAWPSAPTSTQFSINPNLWANGTTGIAYIFAHNAGGFGLTGTDNVITCGSFTSSAGGLATVNLGYEPQWVMVKGSSAVTNWQIMDTMRGFVVGAANAGTKYLNANSSSAELDTPPYGLTNTGFDFNGASNITYIYIAIRRGPMKVPTSGTSVFAPALGTSASTIPTFVTNFPVDLGFYHSRANVANWFLSSRLQGGGTLNTNTTLAEAAPDANYAFDSNTGWGKNFNSDRASSNFRRAPSFFDEVCYTGNGGINNIQNHALASSIGMLIVKRRDSAGNWSVFAQESGGNYSYWNSSGTGTGQGLNGNGAATGTNYSGFNTYLTSASFNAAQIAGSNDINASSATYVAYLFATCAGVSKVGSYTGTGAAQTINCGFTGGSRFVLIKRTDSTGDWYVWDSARGIIPSNDPYLLLNSTAAEVTGTDYVDTTSVGFDITSTAPAAINANGGSFIFLAIA
jgi:hypothetical protein